MMRIRKTLLFFISALILIMLGACGLQKELNEFKKEDGKFKIVATTTMIKDLAEQIGKDKVKVYGIMGPGIDPHTYESQPNDSKAIPVGDLLIVSGVGMEAKVLDSFISIAKSNNKSVLNLGDTLLEKYGTIDENKKLTREPGFLKWFENGKEDGLDPHFWSDIRLWKEAAKLVGNRLAELDENNENFYLTNTTNYINELNELITFVEDKIKEVPEEKRIVITAHDAFAYLAHQFKFEMMAIQGISTDSEATINDIKKTAQQAKENNVKAIFVESSIPAKTIKQVVNQAKALGHNLILVNTPLFADALGTSEEKTETYIKMYKHNINTIIDNLK